MSAKTVETIERLAIRSRPEGAPIMHQTWEKLLFLHWSFSPDVVRSLIPDKLELDTFDGKAWVGVTPFGLSDVRPIPGPAIPGLSSFHELNVRTYVHYEGIPGVWFFSLDASKTIPALAARWLYALPYMKAEIDFRENNNSLFFSSRRRSAPAAEFDALWRPGISLRDPDVESLAFFLVERYCLYAHREGRLYRARIYHAPWALREAEMLALRSTMIESHGLPSPIGAPAAHHADRQEVEIWAPEEIA